MLIVRALVMLLALTAAAAADCRCGKAQTTASIASHRHHSHSRIAPVFYGYGADRRRALRDAWCGKQFNERRHVRPDMPMGC